jgi:outer membrane protein OmpA-like peptidoglycan-associated protein
LTLLLTALLAVLLVACAGPRDQVVLLEVTDPGGALTLRTPQATQTLQTPYQTAAAEKSGQIRPGTTTPDAVQARYGAVLGLLPAPGRLWTLRFATGQTTLEPESQAEVPALLSVIAERAAVEVVIEGHTDQAGDDAANDTLSLARAEAVRALLVAQGLVAPFVRVVGRGSRAPIVDAPGQAEASNRRVEVIVR